MDIEIRIKPQSALKLVDFGELWRYRDLLTTLVWRDFSVKYRQTILGPIWFLLQPLLPTVVFTVIFGKVAGIPTDGIPGFLFFLSNQIMWGYFAANYTSTSTSLGQNLHLFSKVYVPKIVMPVASLVSNGFAIAVQFVLWWVAWIWFRTQGGDGVQLELRLSMVWIPFIFLLGALQGLGFGLWMTTFTAKYRDLQHISPVIVQLWMYGSAVIFPLSHIPAHYQSWVAANPVTFVMEAFRLCLLGVGTISIGMALYSIGMTLLVLFSGFYVFNRTSRTFVDVA